MIQFTKGDILQAETEALVNTVNCVGVAGRGIALQFRKAFPDNFKQYQAACRRREVQPGKMLVFDSEHLTHPRFIINFPTKRHWRGKSRLEDIDHGLVDLVETIRRLGIESIAIPPLGSGLGGLDWEDVRPRIEHALGDIQDIHTIVYEPLSLPKPEVVEIMKDVPAMTAGRAALVGLIDRYLAGLMDPFVTLLEIHKLMYFVQEGGEPLRLRYAKGTYGPYAENLRHVLEHIEGHLITGYSDRNDSPGQQIELVPGAATDAGQFLADHPDTQARFDKVANLVEGFESSLGLELLSTVHWVASREEATDEETAMELISEWNERKRVFSRHQIHVAWNTLVSKGWIHGLADAQLSK